MCELVLSRRRRRRSSRPRRLRSPSPASSPSTAFGASAAASAAAASSSSSTGVRIVSTVTTGSSGSAAALDPGGQRDVADGDGAVHRQVGDVDHDLVGDVARRGDDLELVHRQVDQAVVGDDRLGLTDETDGHGDRDLGLEVDLDEVDVLDVAAHGVALHVLDDRRVHGVVDGEVEDRVHARRAGQGAAQLTTVDGDAERIHAEAVHDGRNRILGAQATRVGAAGVAPGFGYENGLRHGLISLYERSYEQRTMLAVPPADATCPIRLPDTPVGPAGVVRPARVPRPSPRRSAPGAGRSRPSRRSGTSHRRPGPGVRVRTAP